MSYILTVKWRCSHDNLKCTVVSGPSMLIASKHKRQSSFSLRTHLTQVAASAGLQLTPDPLSFVQRAGHVALLKLESHNYFETFRLVSVPLLKTDPPQY